MAPRSAARKQDPTLFEDYSAKDIEVLEGLEPVRKRPGMYIGGTDDKALHHLFAEVLDNSMDEAVACHASRIEVELHEDGYLSVTDNGPGLEGVSLAKLEEPFYSTRSSGEGMGLGLAITAEIIRAHGGELTAGEVAGEGAVFEMTLAKEGT